VLSIDTTAPTIVDALRGTTPLGDTATLVVGESLTLDVLVDDDPPGMGHYVATYRLDLYLQDSPLGPGSVITRSDGLGSRRFQVVEPLVPATYEVRAVARDLDGNRRDRVWMLNVGANEAPNVNLHAGGVTEVETRSTVDVTAEASDDVGVVAIVLRQ